MEVEFLFLDVMRIYVLLQILPNVYLDNNSFQNLQSIDYRIRLYQRVLKEH